MKCSNCKKEGHNKRTCNINLKINPINMYMDNRSESQAHGFTYEDQLKICYSFTGHVKYNSRHDIPSQMNPLGVNISIKSTGNENIVCMSDCMRLYDNEERLYLCVIIYEQKEKSKKLKKIIEIDLSNSRELLFGSLSRLQIEKLDTLIKSIPKGKVSHVDREKIHDLKKELNKSSGCIYLNPKCDSNGQRRLQCSFNNFKKFIIDNKNRIVNESDNGQFRNGKIPEEIFSSPRKRNIK